MQQLVEGWTERVKTQLFADGNPFDLTGYSTPPASVVMVLFDKAGHAVTFAGTTGIQAGTETTGIVYFDPTATDLKASLSPYTVRWKVTDSAGKIAFFPNTDPEEWDVATVAGSVT